MNNPFINNYKRSFTHRDNLGLKGASTAMQDYIYDTLNNVTPRPFYWCFLLWNYYDYYKNVKPSREEMTYKSFIRPFQMKNDYFFVLANLIAGSSDNDLYTVAGKDRTSSILKKLPKGPFNYDDKYLQQRFGGMQYYNAGCLSLGLITEHNREGTENYDFPKVAQPCGEQLAIAFENVIKETNYYKEYRLKPSPSVPREVLKELGLILNPTMKDPKFKECKELIKKVIFEGHWRNKGLNESKEYAIFLNEKHNVLFPSQEETRHILFDYFSPRGDKLYIPANIKPVSNLWEIVIARQYLVAGIEMIWVNMMDILSKNPGITKKQWIKLAIDGHPFLEKKTGEILSDCNYQFKERENLIRQKGIENGLKIILSIYNRLINRDDFKEREKEILEAYGYAISMVDFFRKVDEYNKQSAKEFISFIIDKWIIDRHEISAFNKLLQGRDAYYYECVGGKYFYKEMPSVNFQGIHFKELFHVLYDLNMLKENK